MLGERSALAPAGPAATRAGGDVLRPAAGHGLEPRPGGPVPAAGRGSAGGRGL